MSAATLFRKATRGDGWVAAGDAACAFDPLSGQGIFKALDGGMRAAEAVALFAGELAEDLPYVEWIEDERRAAEALRLRLDSRAADG